MQKARLDQELVSRKIISTRSQAESYIRLGFVKINGKTITKPGHVVSQSDKIEITSQTKYVSRAGFKLESVAGVFGLNFRDKTVLDIGSSTGGFTDFALQKGAKKVIAVELGTKQMHPSLLNNRKLELHEQTDIRSIKKLSSRPDIVLLDLSFISLRDILPSVLRLIDKKTIVIAMVKPQFEAINSNLKHKGVIKNENIRRNIIKDFEVWATQYFKIIDKQDSEIAGEKGNRERFFVMVSL